MVDNARLYSIKHSQIPVEHHLHTANGVYHSLNSCNDREVLHYIIFFTRCAQFPTEVIAFYNNLFTIGDNTFYINNILFRH